ncbi:MAG: rhomboid family intramembrane serine protease [Planctomycetota bacterium]
MFIVPGEIDRNGNRQFPWVTLGLALLLLGFSVYAQWAFSQEIEGVRVRLEEKASTVYAYINKARSEYMGALRNIATRVKADPRMTEETFRQELEQVVLERKKEWAEIDRTLFPKDAENNVYRELGFVPDHSLGLLTAPFTHGRAGHLLVALFFLLLFGMKTEAAWGRLGALVVFVLGATVGSFVHSPMIIDPANTVYKPALGAFAGVSALLGAALAAAPLDPLNFLFVRFRGRETEVYPLPIPLYVVGALWANVVLFNSLLGLDSTPFYSGFDWRACLTGAAVGSVLSLCGRILLRGESASIVPVAASGEPVAKGASYKQHPSYAVLQAAQRDGRIDEALQLLGTLCEIYRDEAGPFLETYGIHVLHRDRERALVAMRSAAALALRTQDEELGLKCYRTLGKDYPGEVLEPGDQFKIAGTLEKREAYNEAVMAYKGVYDKFPEEAVAVKARFKHAEICLRKLNTPHLAIALARKAKQISQGDLYWKDALDRLIEQATAALHGEEKGST